MRIKNTGMLTLLAPVPRVTPAPQVVVVVRQPIAVSRYPKGLGEDALHHFSQHPNSALYVRDDVREPVMNVWFR